MSEQKITVAVARDGVPNSPELRAIVAQVVAKSLNRHPNYPRICLSCGSRETLDGSLPCAH